VVIGAVVLVGRSWAYRASGGQCVIESVVAGFCMLDDEC